MNTRRQTQSEESANKIESNTLDRRAFLRTGATAAAGTLVARALVAADRDWSGKTPVRYPDADILSLDPRFDKYKIGNTPIQRLATGYLWAEGCAWNGS